MPCPDCFWLGEVPFLRWQHRSRELVTQQHTLRDWDSWSPWIRVNKRMNLQTQTFSLRNAKWQRSWCTLVWEARNVLHGWQPSVLWTAAPLVRFNGLVLDPSHMEKKESQQSASAAGSECITPFIELRAPFWLGPPRSTKNSWCRNCGVPAPETTVMRLARVKRSCLQLETSIWWDDMPHRAPTICRR